VTDGATKRRDIGIKNIGHQVSRIAYIGGMPRAGNVVSVDDTSWRRHETHVAQNRIKRPRGTVRLVHIKEI
jgi:hypothetical protein